MDPSRRSTSGMSKQEIACTSLQATPSPLAALAWSDDQQWIASGALDQSVRVWDVRSGNGLFVLEGHRSYIRSIAFGQSREQLLSAAGDGTMRLWALPARCSRRSSRDTQMASTTHLRREPQSSPVRWPDRTIRLWDISTAARERDRRAGSPCPMSGVARRPAAVPVVRRRYPALGRGDWRVPADFSGPQRHDSIRGVEPRLSPVFRPPMTARCGFGIRNRTLCFMCFCGHCSKCVVNAAALHQSDRVPFAATPADSGVAMTQRPIQTIPE